MKRYLSFAAGFAILLGLFLAVQPSKAQVYADYDLLLRTNVPYDSLAIDDPQVTVLNNNQFWVPPSNIANRDDGYMLVNIGFPFQYNGIVYNQVYISINGFITFDPPPNVMANDSRALFTIENSYANNVVAPFWGDHFLRTAADNQGLPVGANRWMPSNVLVKTDLDEGVFVVEWKNLNILNKTITSSVADFQVRLYRSTDPNSHHGSIEFCYGTAGRRSGQMTNDNRVITVGSSVGIKGESGVLGMLADFINGLKHNGSKLDQITLKSYSEFWPPSGGTDKRFYFDPVVRTTVGTMWGDGDADMSKSVGQRHFEFQNLQNRYVTINDSRVIMKSIATKVPLDSVRGRAAFHGDVNHNGRFIYTKEGQKYNIHWRSKEYNQDLPLDLIGNEKQIMFQVTEHDASLILHYISARIPELPWLLDTIVSYGRGFAEEEIASNYRFGVAEKVSADIFRIPVYLDGYFNGPISGKFEINANINDITKMINAEQQLVIENYENNIVFIGNGEFNPNEPICYITVTSNDDVIGVENIRFNDEEITNEQISVETETQEVEYLMQNAPNPFNNNTLITVNVQEAGNYTIVIYDTKGSVINVLVSEFLTAGPHSFTWDGVDQAGNRVENGVYVYRLNGENVSSAKKMIVNR